MDGSTWRDVELARGSARSGIAVMIVRDISSGTEWRAIVGQALEMSAALHVSFDLMMDERCQFGLIM